MRKAALLRATALPSRHGVSVKLFGQNERFAVWLGGGFATRANELRREDLFSTSADLREKLAISFSHFCARVRHLSACSTASDESWGRWLGLPVYARDPSLRLRTATVRMTATPTETVPGVEVKVAIRPRPA